MDGIVGVTKFNIGGQRELKNDISIIIDRTIDEANFMVEKQCTIRDCAKHFHTSKSTVHKDMKERLPSINGSLHKEVYSLLQENLKERAVRGGTATQRKYKGKKRIMGGKYA